MYVDRDEDWPHWDNSKSDSSTSVSPYILWVILRLRPDASEEIKKIKRLSLELGFVKFETAPIYLTSIDDKRKLAGKAQFDRYNDRENNRRTVELMRRAKRIIGVWGLIRDGDRKRVTGLVETMHEAAYPAPKIECLDILNHDPVGVVQFKGLAKPIKWIETEKVNIRRW